MTCREFADFIADYLSGEVSSSTHEELERHLGLCPNCRRYLTIYEETIRLGKAAFEEPDAALPADVPDELVAAILAARLRG